MCECRVGNVVRDPIELLSPFLSRFCGLAYPTSTELILRTSINSCHTPLTQMSASLGKKATGLQKRPGLPLGYYIVYLRGTQLIILVLSLTAGS